MSSSTGTFEIAGPIRAGRVHVVNLLKEHEPQEMCNIRFASGDGINRSCIKVCLDTRSISPLLEVRESNQIAGGSFGMTLQLQQAVSPTYNH